MSMETSNYGGPKESVIVKHDHNNNAVKQTNFFDQCPWGLPKSRPLRCTNVLHSLLMCMLREDEV